ncbi:MAG: hypothetical protein RJB13_992 [Pseudomonadota bacterium]
MGKKLPTGETKLFLCAALASICSLASFQSAFAADYQVCSQETLSQFDCLPGSGGTSTLPSAITLQSDGGTEGVTVFNWKVKNCKQKASQLRGRLSIVLDNSKSSTTTDPDATRANVINSFVNEFTLKALQSGVSTNDPIYPKIGLTSYNGRVGVSNSDTPVDGYNAGFTPSYCSLSTYPAPESVTAWNESDGSTKYSRCEYLPLVAADAYSIAVNNLRAFASFTATQPRGSTDFTYFFKAAESTLSVANPQNLGNNVIVVTDGLPNIPKNVAAETCKSSPRLQNEEILSGVPLSGAGTKEYCVDRQVLVAIDEANREALLPAYSNINFHHVLYTESQRAYFDYDEAGKPSVNPASFLIENSARTGNGKVKFSYATSENELQKQLEKTFDQMDLNALQYVRVRVQPAGGGEFNYNAVSPSAPNSDFSIKFVGLKTGTNKVTVSPVYQDGSSSSQTFDIIVGANSASSSNLSCVKQDTSLTVDGDPRGDKTPDGDGFYHTPENGNFRDYRNNDPSNLISENEFAVVGDEQASAGLRKLRLQGGTGNCGVMASVGRSSSHSHMLLWALLLAPLVFVRVFRRCNRRKS